MAACFETGSSPMDEPLSDCESLGDPVDSDTWKTEGGVSARAVDSLPSGSTKVRKQSKSGSTLLAGDTVTGRDLYCEGGAARSES